MMQNDNGSTRQMYQGNWSCAQCGTDIKELPFEPNPDRLGDLKCRDCHRDSRPPRRQGQHGQGGFSGRRMFSGNWKCADCGSSITELPFEPRDTGNLRCRDCFKK